MLTSRDIAPAVAHHEAVTEIDIEFLCSLKQQTGLRLAAGAVISIDMTTNLDRVYGQFGFQSLMQGIKIFTALLAGRDIGLIGNNDVEKSVLAQTAQRGGYAGQQFKF